MTEWMNEWTDKAWPEKNKVESELSWIKWWKEEYVRISRICIKLYVTWKDPKENPKLSTLLTTLKVYEKLGLKKKYKKYGMM